MNPTDKDSDTENKKQEDKVESDNTTSGSNLVRSYNLTYEQIKKQAMDDEGEKKPEKDSSEKDKPEKKEPEKEKKKQGKSRFSRIASQFKKVEIDNPLDKLKDNQTSWLKENKLIVIIAVILVGMLLAWLTSKIFFNKPKSNKKELSGLAIADLGTQVKVFKAVKGDFTDSLNTMGTVKGFAQTNLGFQVSGVVSAFHFREGDEVREGEIIAQLDPQEQFLKYEQAKAEFENAQKLYELGAIIPLKLQEAKLKLDLAQTELAKMAIIAPSDGLLGSRDVEIGSAVNPNMKVATFLDIDDVFAEIGIPEREIRDIALGQTVKLTVDAYPDEDFGGTVTNIAPMVKGKSKTINIRVQIPNPFGILLPGMFVRARIKKYEVKNTIVIPRTSLKKVRDVYHVFTVNQNNKAEFKPVKLEYTTSREAVIAEGINEGELVVVEGMEELKDGAKVQVMEYQSTAF